MTHTLLELTKMSQEQLRSLGEELHIKKAKDMDLSDLSMSILDEEAKIASKIPDPEPPKRKRGRPRKNDAVQSDDAPEPKKTAKNTKTAEKPLKVNDKKASPKSDEANNQPDLSRKEDKQTSDRKEKSVPAQQDKTAPKKRGRKPKQPEQSEHTVPEVNKGTETPKADKVKVQQEDNAQRPVVKQS